MQRDETKKTEKKISLLIINLWSRGLNLDILALDHKFQYFAMAHCHPLSFPLSFL